MLLANDAVGSARANNAKRITRLIDCSSELLCCVGTLTGFLLLSRPHRCNCAEYACYPASQLPKSMTFGFTENKGLARTVGITYPCLYAKACTSWSDLCPQAQCPLT